MTTAKKSTTSSKTATRKPRATKASQPIPDLPANPFVFEIFDVVSKQRSAAKKVEALQKFSHPCLKSLFIWNFDETVLSALPAGDVPYAAIDGETGFKGTLTEKIEDAASKMEELGSKSLGSQDLSLIHI